tara:strand:+ start:170 stop:343 length:174 start_codon:yes stop_codon:yes gene_type:complete
MINQKSIPISFCNSGPYYLPKLSKSNITTRLPPIAQNILRQMRRKDSLGKAVYKLLY